MGKMSQFLMSKTLCQFKASEESVSERMPTPQAASCDANSIAECVKTKKRRAEEGSFMKKERTKREKSLILLTAASDCQWIWVGKENIQVSCNSSH